MGHSHDKQVLSPGNLASTVKREVKRLHTSNLLEDRELQRITNEFVISDTDKMGSLPFAEVVAVLDRLNIHPAHEEVNAAFRHVDQEGLGALDLGHFIQLYRMLDECPELDQTFAEFARHPEEMSLRTLGEFLREFQAMTPAEVDHTLAEIQALQPGKDSISLLLFYHLLVREENGWLAPASKEVCQPMDMRMIDYWIYSSHNTYLDGNQLNSHSRADMYRRVLRDGCRCVELDCWDGPDGEPIIYHGHTATTKMKFEEAVAAIHETAFEASPFPVILSLEVHCCLEQQTRMAEIMRKGFGPRLKLPGSGAVGHHSFSPDGLRERILVKGKVLSDRNVNESDSESDCEGLPAPTPTRIAHMNRTLRQSFQRTNGGAKTGEERKPKKKMTTSKELSDITWMMAVKCKDVAERLGQAAPFEVSSLDEDKAGLHCRESLEAYRRLNHKCFSRVYPRNTRVDSSNYAPGAYFAAGCHMVALNLQTEDVETWQLRAYFQANGMCGYTVKPQHLRFETDPPGPDILKVKIVSGRRLPSANRQFVDVPHPFVEVLVQGAQDRPDRRATHVRWHNALHPVWDEEFEFTVADRCCTTLLLVVRDNVKDGSRPLLGQNAAVVGDIRPGFRVVPLLSASGSRLPGAQLLIHTQLFPVPGRPDGPRGVAANPGAPLAGGPRNGVGPEPVLSSPCLAAASPEDPLLPSPDPPDPTTPDVAPVVDPAPASGPTRGGDSGGRDAREETRITMESADPTGRVRYLPSVELYAPGASWGDEDPTSSTSRACPPTRNQTQCQSLTRAGS